MTRLSLAVALAVSASACASAPPVRRSPDHVARAEVLPDGFESLGTAQADCRRRSGFGPAHGEVLASFDCDRERLDRALAEQASLAGGDILVRRRCVERGSLLSCSGQIGRDAREDRALAPPAAERTPAPGPVAVHRWDEPRTLASFAIEIDFEPQEPGYAGRKRKADRVGELGVLPVSHRDLGTLTARCDEGDCEFRELRRGLRIAAGGLGATEVVAIRCLSRRSQRECIATVAASEVDPELEPSAR